MSSTQNERDANKDIASPQPQAPVSPQAHDTSPPASQQTLSVVSSEDDRSAIVLQPKSRRRSKPVNRILIGIAIALIVVGAAVWVLNITGTIKGPWSGIVIAIFTAGAVIITLIQLYLQFKAMPVVSITTTPLLPDTQHPDSFDEEFSIPRPSGQEGVLLVYTKKILRGFSIDLCRGYGDSTDTYAAQNIVERKIRGHTYHIAVFQSLPPGRYTAHVYNQELVAKVMIYSGQVTEIDWR